MASPHVAGVLALMLENNANATPAELVDGVKSRGTANVLSGTGVGSPNLFLYSLISSASAPVTGPVRSVAVAGLEATSLSARKAWVALVRIRVKDASGSAVSGAVVSGSFTAGGHQVSCTSSSSGECLIYSGLIRNGTATTTFSVTGIAGSAMQYMPGTNTASSITVAKPL
jgi:subtilisin family serine protease